MLGEVALRGERRHRRGIAGQDARDLLDRELQDLLRRLGLREHDAGAGQRFQASTRCFARRHIDDGGDHRQSVGVDRAGAVFLDLEDAAVPAKALVCIPEGSHLAQHAALHASVHKLATLGRREVQRSQLVDDLAWRAVAEHVGKGRVHVSVEVVLDQHNAHERVFRQAPEALLGVAQGTLGVLRSRLDLHRLDSHAQIPGYLVQDIDLF